jgi:hypothetical protein
MDCCREDNTIVPLQMPVFDPKKKGYREPRPTKPYTAMAARWSQRSREVAFAGPAGQPEVRGVFTRVLLEGLRGAAHVNGVVTGASLERWVLQRVPQVASAHGLNSQQPDFDFDRSPGAELTLCTPAQIPTNLRIRVTGENATTLKVVLQGGPSNAANIAPREPRQGAVWEYSLVAGLYVASIPGTKRTAVISDGMLGGPDVEL